jgi:hypothetical protein
LAKKIRYRVNTFGNQEFYIDLPADSLLVSGPEVLSYLSGDMVKRLLGDKKRIEAGHVKKTV